MQRRHCSFKKAHYDHTEAVQFIETIYYTLTSASLRLPAVPTSGRLKLCGKYDTGGAGAWARRRGQ